MNSGGFDLTRPLEEDKMIKQGLVAAATLLAAFTFQPAEQAMAGAGMQFDLSFLDNFPASNDRPGYYNGPGITLASQSIRWLRLSCGQGRRIVKNRGFRQITALDCRGRAYTYKGRKRGRWYTVEIKSSNGRVIRTSPINRGGYRRGYDRGYDRGYYRRYNGYGGYDGYDRWNDQRDDSGYDSPSYRLSCREVMSMVRDRGYYRVRPRDCRGNNYTFHAKKRGVWFKLRVRSSDGRIFRRSRL